MTDTSSFKILLLDSFLTQTHSILSDGKPVSVWVLENSSITEKTLHDHLPQHTSLKDITPLLDESADELTRTLLDLDEQVLQNNADRLAWSASLIGDRSSYVGDLQILAARYLSLHKIVKQGGHHIFLVEDPFLKEILEKTAALNSLSTDAKKQQEDKTKLWPALKARLSYLKRVLPQNFTAKKQKPRQETWNSLQDCDVLIMDWIGENSFSQEKPADSVGNLQRMPSIFRNSGYKVGFIANPLWWTEDFKKIMANVRKAHDPVVMTNDCLTIFSYLKACVFSWKMNIRLKQSMLYKRIDFSPLYNHERRKDLYATHPSMAYSYSEIAKELSKRKIAPKAIIYPFENQGWERALIAGVRQYLPNTQVIAYQHAPFAAKHIGFYPSRSDVAHNRVPDKLMVMGPRFRELFHKHGWPDEKLVLAGSLRFENALTQTAKAPKAGNNTILAATSIALSEAKDLITKASALIIENPSWKLIVNFHPIVEDNFKETIRQSCERLVGTDRMKQIEISNEKTSELIAQSNILIYNNSGAVFDAYFSALPSLYVNITGHITYDKIPNEVSKRATNERELFTKVSDILTNSPQIKPDVSVGGCIEMPKETVILNSIFPQETRANDT